MSDLKQKTVDDIAKINSKIQSINDILQNRELSSNLRSDLLSDLRLNEDLLSVIILKEFSKID